MAKRNPMAPDVVVRFKVNDDPKTLDYQSVPFTAWEELKRVGYTPIGLMTAISGWDFEAIAALIWLERKQRDRKLPFTDVKTEIRRNPPAFELDDVIVDGEDPDDDEPEDEEPDPPTGRETGETPL